MTATYELPGSSRRPIPSVTPVMPGGPVPHVGPGPVPYGSGSEVELHCPGAGAVVRLEYEDGGSDSFGECEGVAARVGRKLSVVAAGLLVAGAVLFTGGRYRTVRRVSH